MGHGSPQNQQKHHVRDVLDPLLIGILGILAGFLVVTAYHCIGVSIFFRRQQLEERSSHRQTTLRNALRHLPDQPGRMFVYSAECEENATAKKGLVPCALGEYEDLEVIRVLPGCLHVFHAACVDTWLSSHSNCPLCRGCTEPPPQVAMTRDGSGDVEPNGGEAVE